MGSKPLLAYSLFVLLLAGVSGCENSVDTSGVTIEQQFSYKPSQGAIDSLFPVFPNPFTRSTEDTALTITFTVSDTSNATVLIQNPVGDAIVSFQGTSLAPGLYTASWIPANASGTLLPPGLYFVTLRVNKYIDSRLVSILNNG